MDNLRNVIKILFRHTSPKEVLSGSVRYGQIARDSFLSLANFYMPYYSRNETENLYAFLSTELDWHKHKMHGCGPVGGQQKISVFDALVLFADKVLTEENEKPLCRYEHLLRWREMTVGLEEDLFIAAFFAQKDILAGYSRIDFFWPPVIGHDNKSLNRLMEKGVAENHFHLKGSAPMFHLSWISIMNDVLNPQFARVFRSYESSRMDRNMSYSDEYTEDGLYQTYLQAALLRLYLFACLKDDSFALVRRGIQDPDTREKVSLRDGKRREQMRMYQDVAYLLSHPGELEFYLSDIQDCIVKMRHKYAAGQLDYTICEGFLIQNQHDRLNEVICGERYFMYEIYRKIYSGDRQFLGNLDWFYAYLLIKQNLRAELIQANGKLGFRNFSRYQDRKEQFIDHTPFEKVYVQMAVRDTIKNQHIVSLETRITPKDTAAALKAAIEKNDNAILEKENDQDKTSFKNRFFYVCHFIKEPDMQAETADRLKQRDAFCEYSGVCRHYTHRQKVKKQAYAIYNFRRNYGGLANRLRGIDAASEEIGCRPEVFAQAFRFLRAQQASYFDSRTCRRYPIEGLSVTYHVGEDFLDIIDGLRAIDEAVCFLNMRCADRLGHALALGVDVEEWYALKSGRIVISQMDYLDNLAWLYAKIRTYRMEGCEDAVRYIEKRFDEYFRNIYLDHMDQAHAQITAKEAESYYRTRGIQSNYGYGVGDFSINSYYDSWKLRGDSPEYFKSGYFRLPGSYGSKWDEHGVNKEFPDNYRIRYDPRAAYLYYTYHYNQRVKAEGYKIKEIKVNPAIIRAVKKAQRGMQWEIAKKGICIEANPSSNALIGTFKRYDKHPILNWYSEGLENSGIQGQYAPQLQVCVNTDDQGVFATYIENEYAYLALALEKMRGEDGCPKYSRALIYHWLDHVREMGLAQSFGTNCHDRTSAPKEA